MNKIKDIAWVTFIIVVLGYFVYLFVKRSLTDHIPKDSPHMNAVIIDSRNYNGNSPVRNDYTYSYSFNVNGKTYTGDSHDQTLKVGDSVEIEYNKNYPSINKPVHPKE